jgi:hypothetical protein
MTLEQLAVDDELLAADDERLKEHVRYAILNPIPL